MNCTHCATPVPDTAPFCPNCGKPLESAPPKDPLAAVTKALETRYEVTSQIGKDAFGEVYKARDVVLDRTVAIKRVRLDWLEDDEYARDVQRRFIREAQVSAQLHHPNIVTTYDVVSVGNAGYIIREYIDGTTLADKLASKTPVPLSETLYTLSRVAKALHDAHQHEVVHRDIKPANILLSREGHVKVTDFGIAKVEAVPNVTQAGLIPGKPHYMSPEQAGGGPVDGRSDLFSVGCILYECITGEPPFDAQSTTGVLVRIVNDTPAAIDTERRGIPVEVQNVVDRALAKDPTKRYSSADELARALDSIPGASSSKAIPVTAGDEVTENNANESPDPDSGIPDSVADSLMKEARRTARIGPQLLAFKGETRKLELARSPILQFQNVGLTPEEAYILSRIQENVRPREILSISPLSEEETARTLLGFLRTGLVTFVDDGETPIERDSDRLGSTRAGALPRDEIELLYRELVEADDWDVLELPRESSAQDVKRAFLAQAFRFHPDRYAVIEDDDFQEKVSWLFQRVSDAFASLSATQRRERSA